MIKIAMRKKLCRIKKKDRNTTKKIALLSKIANILTLKLVHIFIVCLFIFLLL